MCTFLWPLNKHHFVFYTDTEFGLNLRSFVICYIKEKLDTTGVFIASLMMVFY